MNSSKYYDETGLSNVSKTRAFRIRARGIGGYSSWTYSKHVFAAPYAAEITDHKVSYNDADNVCDIYAKWDTPQDAGHPVDYYVLQYRIGKPAAGMDVTADGSWVDTGQTTAGDIAVMVTEQIDDDECMWLRVAAAHDNHSGANAVTGTPVRAYTGKVAAPESLSITNSSLSTREVSISVKNNSAISDSKIALCFQPSNDPRKSVIVDILTGSGTITKSGIKCPDWSGTGTLGFKAYAFVGDVTYQTDSTGVKHYSVIAAMQSDVIFTGGGIPKAPSTMSAVKSGTDILVTWDWTWEEANGAEISWSENPKAWESTDEPQTYEVDVTGPAHLYVSDVDMGKVYYVRVRLFYDDGEGVTYGPYSGTEMVYMTEAPQKPVLDVSSDHVKPEDDLTLSWTYVSMDGTPQVYAQIDELTYSGNTPVYTKRAETASAQHVTIVPNWTPGTQHNLVLKVMSESGKESEYSDGVVVTAVTPPTCTITQVNLTSGDDGYELQALPLTVTVTGAGTAGTTVLEIVRAEDFVQKMPDDSQFNGFAGELISRRIYSGEAQQSFSLNDIAAGAHLDDTADYKIVATVIDGYGQTDEAAVDFKVAWSVQPVKPSASVEIHDTAAYITLTKPTGASNTDRMDIYRLSVDGPELIYQDAQFNDVVVDPYPAVGEYGGYRVVMKTVNGDFYRAEQVPAWEDYDAGFNSIYQYIDFDGFTLPLALNVDLDSGWAKDFKLTKYLGGHYEGDWLEGVDRTGTIASVLLTEEDTDDIRTLRKLAKYSGAAQIRSKDGSSYAANVNVTNEGMEHVTGGMYRSVTLAIQQTRRAQLDGLLQAEWEA